MTEAVFTVSGMTCGHCVSSVTEEISQIGGVQNVAVQLDSGKVTVTSDQPVGEDEVRAAVTEAGYTLVSN